MSKNSSTNKTNNYYKAFTLVELAIVLIIIGLITGGVVGAQSLISSANRQKIIRSFNEYQTIYNAFQLEYDGKPGDFNEAAEYWPSQAVNGDGDGKIEWSATHQGETLDFFEHLYLAEFLSVAYTGENASPSQLTMNVNIPEGPVNSDTGFFIYDQLGMLGYDPYNVLSLGGVPSNATYFNGEGAVRPKDAKSIDEKIDDGNYASGRIMFQNHYASEDDWTSDSCHSGNRLNTTGNLILSNNNRDCIMFMWLDGFKGN